MRFGARFHVYFREARRQKKERSDADKR